jgi:aspartyl protease family protein
MIRQESWVMTRPLVWALGMLVMTGLSSVVTADRMAAIVDKIKGTPSEYRSSQAKAQSSTLSSSPSSMSSGLGTLVLQADLNGHFTVHPELEGQRIRMLVDTGATLIALSHEDADKIGLRPLMGGFTKKLSTANGVIDAAPIHLREVRLGPFTVRNVEAVILPKGLLTTSLLGMSFLKRLNGFEVSQGRLTLKGS